jgi:hypothetical protein
MATKKKGLIYGGIALLVLLLFGGKANAKSAPLIEPPAPEPEPEPIPDLPPPAQDFPSRPDPISGLLRRISERLLNSQNQPQGSQGWRDI